MLVSVCLVPRTWQADHGEVYRPVGGQHADEEGHAGDTDVGARRHEEGNRLQGQPSNSLEAALGSIR